MHAYDESVSGEPGLRSVNTRYVPEPTNGTETFLAEILDTLRDIREQFDTLRTELALVRALVTPANATPADEPRPVSESGNVDGPGSGNPRSRLRRSAKSTTEYGSF